VEIGKGPFKSDAVNEALSDEVVLDLFGGRVDTSGVADKIDNVRVRSHTPAQGELEIDVKGQRESEGAYKKKSISGKPVSERLIKG